MGAAWRFDPYDDELRAILKTWGKNIGAARNALGLTQMDLANKLAPSRSRGKCHLQTVGSWERGLTEPSMRDKAMLAGVLGVPLHTLFAWPVPDMESEEL